ncbi:NUDIX domain-containing protein [Verrucosispora sp. WMMA2044]|uniref:NUDIX hydrolase n=1 Tax=Verrucosispora sp. WMMA2044 TaxID=3016419 RepID=UPI00248B5CC7|nr:NUDIX domain-containing protein [Verrucosispora sp. WMMA2044]WBB47291.1 NUDIX domain-containing protein [Verrucosispora sp. WMMA2044]
MPDDKQWTAPLIAVAVDLAVFTVLAGRFVVLLVERGIEPDRGLLALPGGFLSTVEEDLTSAAVRELTEETGLDPSRIHLEQLATYGAPDRDPRQRVITVCYLALVPTPGAPTAGGDARHVDWYPVEEVLAEPTRLAFDHAQILADAVERARSKLEYTTVATSFCGPEFTMSELRRVYEIVWGRSLDARNFHRKVLTVPDFVRPTGAQTTRNGGRPAALYRPGETWLVQIPILRARSEEAHHVR